MRRSITVQYSFRAVSGSLLVPSCRGAAVAGAVPPTAGPSAALWGPGASGDGTPGWRGPMAVDAAVAAPESRTAVAAIDDGGVDAEAVQGYEVVGDGWRARPIAKGRVCMNLHVRAMVGTGAGMHEYSFGHGAGARLGPLVP